LQKIQNIVCSEHNIIQEQHSIKLLPLLTQLKQRLKRFVPQLSQIVDTS